MSQEEITALTDELEKLKAISGQSKERVEELVLGLGKESAGIISQYEEKVETLETERQQLLLQIQQLSSQVGLLMCFRHLCSNLHWKVTDLRLGLG